MAIVDFHLHFFSRPFFEALATQSPLDGTSEEKLAWVSEKTGIEIPPSDTQQHLARWLESLEHGWVEHAAAFASLPDEVPAVAEAVASSGGKLSGFALVDPRSDEAPGKVRTLLEERGFRGVILFPAMHHYRVGGPEAARVLAVLEEHRGIAYVHCGLLVVKLRDLLGLPRVQDLAFANPLDVIPTANAHPNVTFVIPHFGAGFFRETLMAGSMCPNVCVDTSSSNSWIQTQTPALDLVEVLRRTLDCLGPERILFGTDSNVFPAGWRKDRYDEQLEALDRIGMNAAEKEMIFRGNARRLLRLA